MSTWKSVTLGVCVMSLMAFLWWQWSEPEATSLRLAPRQDQSLEIPEDLANEVLARAARQILSGDPVPRVSDFPRAFVDTPSAEILVLLRSGSKSRLWRSARASNVAEALITAALAARARWQERDKAMGGALSDDLALLDVLVAHLIKEREPLRSRLEDLDARLGPNQGVGFEGGGRWRYRLPEEIESAGGVRRALVDLLAQENLGFEAVEQGEVRVYRFTLVELALSKAAGGAGS